MRLEAVSVYLGRQPLCNRCVFCGVSDLEMAHSIHVWVCLKIGYIPNYSHLIGIMIINHWV